LNLKENEDKSRLRLQVYLAHAGAASRRGGEKLITQGRVTVNGKVVSELGARVLPGDEVCLDGKPVNIESRLHYLALNKPAGYICSSRDPQNRPLALELLPPCGERLYSVGRLDFLSSGLIFFTNDGGFAAKISHPASEIEKEYLVESTVPIPGRMVEEFAGGVLIDGILYRAGEIERTGPRSLRVVLIEGKNREIRRVFSHFHLHPKILRRIRIGPVKLGNLEEGKCRNLSAGEIEGLVNPSPVFQNSRF
jgi:23S rRNA pseudouridine2605 synthase